MHKFFIPYSTTGKSKFFTFRPERFKFQTFDTLKSLILRELTKRYELIPVMLLNSFFFNFFSSQSNNKNIPKVPKTKESVKK